MKKRRWFKALCLALAISVVLSLGGVAAFAEDCGEIRERILRLHVLANSNSETDQALKLKVRDAVIEAAAGLLDTVTSKEEAVAVVQQALPSLTQTAQECVWEQSYDYPVKAELCEMYFTTRVYETGTLPAGVYSALRITIGEGAGRNWWCVVYPSLCLSSAGRQAQWSDVLNTQQTDIVEHPEKYQVRFKILEWAQSLWDAVSGWW